jgi:hypothetical protein
VLEVTLVRLARRDVSTIEALADRVARLERALQAVLQGDAPQPPQRQGAPAPAGIPSSTNVTAEPPRPAARSGPQAALGALRKPPARAAAAPTPSPSPPPPSPPEPEAAPEPAAAEGPLTLDDVTAAWAKAVEGFRPRLKAMAKEAHPVRVDGDTVVVGLPTRFEKVHLPTITGDAGTVTAALSDLLGRRVRLNVVLDDDVVSPHAALPPPGGPAPVDVGDGGGAEAMAAEMARPPEPAGGGRGVDSPVGLVIETFGASIESETVRE